MVIEPADERILRAKYLDWCSARVADRFVELTPDQIYELAHHPVASVAGGDSRAGLDSPPLNYASLVARATEALAATLGLPSFEAWRAAYEKTPEQFEEELLGLWKRKV